MYFSKTIQLLFNWSILIQHYLMTLLETCLFGTTLSWNKWYFSELWQHSVMWIILCNVASVMRCCCSLCQCNFQSSASTATKFHLPPLYQGFAVNPIKTGEKLKWATSLSNSLSTSFLTRLTVSLVYSDFFVQCSAGQHLIFTKITDYNVCLVFSNKVTFLYHQSRW